jgi:DNA-binding transcriptional ArsR family regulator
MERSQFGKGDVLAAIEKAGASCSVETTLYLVGGGAMALRGDKDATKDVDLIVEDEVKAIALRTAFIGLGFEVNLQPPPECSALIDAKIMTSPQGMRIDLFVKRVCNKLTLSSGMKARSKLISQYGLISLRMCSREDIFLLKSVTERARDLDDMAALYRQGLDGNTILQECHEQSSYTSTDDERIWEAFLLAKVEEMEDRYGLAVPWKKRLERIARSRLVMHLMRKELEKGPMAVTEICKSLELSPREVRALVTSLEAMGGVIIDRGKRPHTIRLDTMHGNEKS